MIYRIVTYDGREKELGDDGIVSWGGKRMPVSEVPVEAKISIEEKNQMILATLVSVSEGEAPSS